MTSTMKEILNFIKETDIKFIRLAFIDMFGTQKNIAIMPEELERASYYGIPFDGSAIKGFMDVSKSDLLLFPEPSTLCSLPWRPQQGRVIRFLCNIKYPDHTPFIGDTREMLKKTVKHCEDMGYICKIGSECEFYLFTTDENGKPTNIPQDEGTYFDIYPLDKGENIRREISLTLEQMGINPEASHHEQGPGQNEIDFKYSDALNAADNLITFKSVVQTIAGMNGLHASFMPKPLPNHSGNGLHINLSLYKDGKNIFQNDSPYSKESQSFIAGILDKILDITLFLNPLPSSYDRFGSNKAPQYISWSHQNRSQLIRIPAAVGENARAELRSPDPNLNPYLAFSLIIYAGLDGIQKGLSLPEPIDMNLYELDHPITQHLKSLPKNLFEAIQLAKNSDFLKKKLNKEFLDKYISVKEEEWEKYGR